MYLYMIYSERSIPSESNRKIKYYTYHSNRPNIVFQNVRYHSGTLHIGGSAHSSSREMLKLFYPYTRFLL